MFFPVCLFVLELRHPFLSLLSFIPVFLHPLAPVLFHPSSNSCVSSSIHSFARLVPVFIHPLASLSVLSSIYPLTPLVPVFLHPLAPLLFHPSSNSSVSSSILSLPVFLLSPLARLFCDGLVRRSCGCRWFLVVSNALPVSCEL